MHPMRRKDRQLDEKTALALLQAAEYGVLSTADADGQPYGVPLSYVCNKQGTALWFHCARTGHKLENLAGNPKVSFCAVGKTQPVYDDDFTTYFESAIVFGTCVPVNGEEEKTQALLALCEKYLPEHMDKAMPSIAHSGKVTAVYRIDIEGISGKAKAPHGRP